VSAAYTLGLGPRTRRRVKRGKAVGHREGAAEEVDAQADRCGEGAAARVGVESLNCAELLRPHLLLAYHWRAPHARARAAVPAAAPSRRLVLVLQLAAREPRAEQANLEV